ncbi:DUF6629 family protein [Flavobacterium terrigena]|uniref:Uncharacterized protein n=1 Tax=Flavobacterium terrigena TaxID=402734 RepID=A0A1H6QMW3_9FLAO|nr:DUF6629 family protein [Flavobacterium terrigena]SEI40352.1 hypothetical protein SAMN05660918_0369 [Flavobacterium terrigena]
MCFSATASFSAGTVLTVIAFASLKRTTKPKERFFALIPLLFALQQFAEGVLWIILPSSDYTQLEKICTGLFIIIAQIVWPIWVPLSIQKIENKKFSRQLLTFFTGLGFIISLCLAWCFINYEVKAEIDDYHISYHQIYPDIFKGYLGYLYVLVTIIPPFLSSFKRMWLLGLAILISYLVTKIFYANYLISVWCFFAAGISIIVYFVLSEIKDNVTRIYSEVIT